MRRPNREINIFSISALDLFASALGSFILLTVILFPYYLKNHEVVAENTRLQVELQKTQRQLSECQSQLSEAEQRVQQAQAELQDCQEKLAQTFLAVVLKWETAGQDIDLYVLDPEGHEFSYQQHNRSQEHFPGVTAKLSKDSLIGPGVEIYESNPAKSGVYEIYVKLFERNKVTENPIVQTTVYFRDGTLDFPNIHLSREGQKLQIGTFELRSDGSVTPQ